MRRIVNVFLLLVAVGIGAGYLLLGPSVVLGGPSKAEIVRVTRDVMVLTAATPEEDAKARSAAITPRGLCGQNDSGSFACLVEVDLGGTEPASFITVMQKTDAGWVPGQ